MPLSDNPVTSRIDLEASSGAYRAFGLTITNVAGSAVTGWSGSDSLDVQVWRGDDSEALDDAGVTAAWSSAANGTLTIATDGTHELSPSSYQFRLMATNGGRTYEVARGNYLIRNAPGETGNCLPASQRPYTTIDDLRTVAPWIEQAKSEFDRSGFEEQQIAARQWLDSVVMKAYQDRYFLNRYTSINSQYWSNRRDEAPEWLRTSIQSGKGIEITPMLKRACALYACHLICMAQVTVKDDASQYRRKAAEFRNMANNLLISAPVRVKSTLTSTTYDFVVNLNISPRN